MHLDQGCTHIKYFLQNEYKYFHFTTHQDFVLFATAHYGMTYYPECVQSETSPSKDAPESKTRPGPLKSGLEISVETEAKIPSTTTLMPAYSMQMVSAAHTLRVRAED